MSDKLGRSQRGSDEHSAAAAADADAVGGAAAVDTPAAVVADTDCVYGPTEIQAWLTRQLAALLVGAPVDNTECDACAIEPLTRRTFNRLTKLAMVRILP